MKSSSENAVRQFSLRELFVLTSVVAVLLTAGVLCRESRYFRGLYSGWTLATLLIIASVWVVFRLRLVGPRTLAFGSLLLYLVSLCLPVMPFPSRGFVYGWQAAGVSLLERPGVFGVLFTMRGIDRWNDAAFFVGGIANVLFFVGYLALLISLKWRGASTVARWFAVAAFVTAIATRLIFEYQAGVERDTFIFYPGYGVWTASFLALALGSCKKAGDLHKPP